MSTGMDALAGTALVDHDHLRQSVNQILTTPIGSRIMRRAFGSLLPELLDHPLNDYTVLQLYAATATALLLHEPRLRLTRVHLAMLSEHGQATLTIDGITNFSGQSQSASIQVPMRAGSV